MKRRTFLASTTLGATAAVVTTRLPLSAAPRDDPAAPTSPNLLRNGTFQDDWLSLLPQNQTLHWAYANTIYNRRDFQPDGWRCEGNWQWLDADQPAGRRRLILRGPGSMVTQRLHGFAVHDDRTITGFPDAGGFPELRALYSHRPERLVRDLTLRVRLRGDNVPADSGRVEVGLAPLGKPSTSDPLGTLEKPLVSGTTPVPSGTFDWVWIETQLPASAWLAQAAKSPAGSLLPPVVSIAVRFEGAAGHLELGAAHLSESAPRGPNLLPNGGFESVDSERYPSLWDRPAKYHYFPPKHYYLFTTWHNALFDNRGRVEVDELVVASGRHSLKMIVPSGDEVSVTSPPITLNQREPRLIEVLATVKTDRLCMLAIDGVDENGDRLDGFSFIHKAPVSVGTDEWRTVRQVFHPRKPLASLRLVLGARGANGYTLDATGFQPQSNVVGTVWWDDVQVYEPESTPEELAGRRVRTVPRDSDVSGPHLVELDLGERLLGTNELSARLVNAGPDGLFALRWDITSPGGRRSTHSSPASRVSAGGRHQFQVPYTIEEACAAYTEYRGRLTMLRDGQEVGGTDLWFATWPVPIDLKLGALYLDPAQPQFIRLNLGLAASTMADVTSVRVEVV